MHCMCCLLDTSVEVVGHLCSKELQHCLEPVHNVCMYTHRTSLAASPVHVCLDNHIVNDQQSLVFTCSFLGPMLFGCLMALLVWSVFQIFLPPGPVQNTIFSLLGSILFSAYIVYDTDNLIQRKPPLLLSCLQTNGPPSKIILLVYTWHASNTYLLGGLLVCQCYNEV